MPNFAKSDLDLTEAARFLHALDPAVTTFCFQTFDDDVNRKDGTLARVLHGSLDEHAAALTRLSQRGAGVFLTINETDGHGRKTENIVRVRAVFVDLDGAPLEPCMQARLKPHIVVESSPTRWHCYWRVTSMPLDQFEGAQRELIDRFNSDGSVHDLPRVMRLPGFVHQKGKPHLTRVVSLNDAPAYPAANFASKTSDTSLAPALAEIIPPPGRHAALISLARTMSARGVSANAILAAVRVVNAEQCRPPLPDRELPKIAGWAATKPVLAPLVEDDDVTVSDAIIELALARLK